MPSKTTDPTAAITDAFLATLKQSQELATNSLNAWADFAGKTFTMPSLDSLPTGVALPDPREVVEVTFAFAEEVLATQRAFAIKFVDAIAPKVAASA